LKPFYKAGRGGKKNELGGGCPQSSKWKPELKMSEGSTLEEKKDNPQPTTPKGNGLITIPLSTYLAANMINRTNT